MTRWAVTIGLAVGLTQGRAAAQTFQFPPPSPAPKPLPTPAPAAPAAPANSPPPSAGSAIPTLANNGAPVGPSTFSPAPLPPPPLPRLSTAAAAPVAWPPAVLPYREGMPIPQGYHLDSRLNGGLVYGGVVTWAVPYAAGLIAAAASGFSKRSGWVALPIAGPFIAITGRTIDCSFLGTSTSPSGDLQAKEDECRKSAIREVRSVVLLTVGGLLQTTGAILTIAGLMSSHEYLLRSDIFPPDTKLSFDAGYYQGQFRMNALLQF